MQAVDISYVLVCIASWALQFIQSLGFNTAFFFFKQKVDGLNGERNDG